MDNRPIGFFDSGLGGLTCIPYLVKKLPEEKIIYFGDTARTPYGSKAISTIRKFSMQIAEFLVNHDVKMIVIACNTISATCLNMLQEKFPDVPILGIIQPAAQKVINTCGSDNHIGIIGTKATIGSETYSTIIKTFRPVLKVYGKATPAFVPLIEEGIIANDIMEQTIKYYLDDFILDKRIDTLVLGCTHYPLIRDEIERAYPGLKIINPSEEVVGNIQYVLESQDMLAKGSTVKNTFYASDLSENFVNMIDRIFENTDVDVKFKNLDMEA